jgi:hypothetical protein
MTSEQNYSRVPKGQIIRKNWLSKMPDNQETLPIFLLEHDVLTPITPR